MQSLLSHADVRNNNTVSFMWCTVPRCVCVCVLCWYLMLSKLLLYHTDGNLSRLMSKYAESWKELSSYQPKGHYMSLCCKFWKMCQVAIFKIVSAVYSSHDWVWTWYNVEVDTEVTSMTSVGMDFCVANNLIKIDYLNFQDMCIKGLEHRQMLFNTYLMLNHTYIHGPLSPIQQPVSTSWES